MNAYVLSIHPEYAEQIYVGTKVWEVRRRALRALVAGTRMFVYETTPRQMVTGEFVVAENVIGTPSSIARCVPLPGVRQYLKGSKRATALKVSEVCHYRRPLRLEDIGIRQAPMSYARVQDRVRRRQCR